MFVRKLKENLTNHTEKDEIKNLLKSPTCFDDLFQ